MINEDKIWSSYNQELEIAISKNDWFKMGTLYYEMSHFVSDDKQHSKELRELGYKAKLRFQSNELKRLGGMDASFTDLEIMVNEPLRCPACRKNTGKVMTVDEALLNHPLPTKDCINVVGCRCYYAPTFT